MLKQGLILVCRGAFLAGGLCVVLQGAAAWATDPFKPPIAEELAMKSVPGYPGVAAVVLYREEIYNDDLHVIDHYNRIKVLTDEGKKYANVQLDYTVYTPDVSFDVGDDKKVGVIVGRTIHADGTVIPFTGKAYRKTIEKANGLKDMETVFTLPDAEVGSILEYRYKTLTNLSLFEAPNWLIQGELYIKAAHYEWIPTLIPLQDNQGRQISNLSWRAILPPNVRVERQQHAVPGTNILARDYVVDVKEVPPIVEEEFQPPVKSYSYRVLFNFSVYKSGEDYWNAAGKQWSKEVDEFANPNSSVKAFTEKTIAGASTADEKVRKIYAAVMGLENTLYTRSKGDRESAVAGGAKLKNASEVLSAGRGSPDQLTELFIGMVRAAGLPAYAMLVTDRSVQIFSPAWLSFRQFGGFIAIVTIDGKDVYLDPGSRYMPFGHLAWWHTYVGGLRQASGGGTAFAQTQGDQAKENRFVRVANLTLDANGGVTGKIDLVYYGAGAAAWRHTALKGDEESMKRELRTEMEDGWPKSFEVKMGDVTNLQDYEQPLKVSFTVTGTLASVTGKRMLVPADLFLMKTPAVFPHEKREQPVYFHYADAVQDILRVNLPAGFTVETLPAAASLSMPDKQIYSLDVKADATGFTTKRTHLQAQVLVPVNDYGELRKFYEQFQSKDKESVVLMAPASGAENQQ